MVKKMKVQRIRAIVKKDMTKLIRVPATLFMALLFPLILTGAFGLAFGGGTAAGDTVYTIGIVDLDNSTWSNLFIGNLSMSEVLINQSYDSDDTAQIDLAQGKVDAVIIIPDDFGVSLDSYWLNPLNASTWENTTIGLFVDRGSMIVSNALPPLIQQILLTTLYGEQTLSVAQPVTLGTPSGVQSSHNTQFDFMAPGMFAFAAIFLILIVAEGFTEERSAGILRRIQLTPTTPAEIIAGSTIAYMITGIFQIAIVFFAAGFMGFNVGTDPIKILFAFILVSLLVLCNVGFGLIAATLAKTPGTATGISFIFILPQMFFGTFVPISSELIKLVPSYYVTDALTSIFLREAGITSEIVIFDFFVMIGYCIVVVIAGIFMFAKFGREK
jgi:ABC-type transport system involved in multi-copper enzyme maturation permease subunit